MQQFLFEKTEIKDLVIINPFFTEDERGNFIKFYEKDVFKEHGIDFIPYESFESTSIKGVLRGLHFQTENPQAKLIRVPYGKIFDVAVDLRRDSETFGKWYGIELSSENKKAFYIPKGFAHGFLTLSDLAIVSYMCDTKYSKETDSGIVWNDKDINIKWCIRLGEKLTISEKDINLQSFKEFKNGLIVK